MKEGESCDMREGENDPNNPKVEVRWLWRKSS